MQKTVSTLVNLLVDEQQAEQLKQAAQNFLSHTLTERQVCLLEMLSCGALSPLAGFMNQTTWHNVLTQQQLTDGQLYPIPVTLDISAALAKQLNRGDQLALRDGEGFMLAVLTIDDLWQADLEWEAEQLFETSSKNHAGVVRLLEETADYYVGGTIQTIQLPNHFEFEQHWDTPAKVQRYFKRQGWRNVLAFNTAKPMHKRQQKLLLEAAKKHNTNILIHPNIELTHGDVQFFAKIHSYKAVSHYFPSHSSNLSLKALPLWQAGPREALWHCLIEQNYGCSHIFIGSDYASPPDDAGENFYPRYAAQEIIKKHQQALTIKMIAVEQHEYVPEKQDFYPCSVIADEQLNHESLDNVSLKQKFLNNEKIPTWFSYPEVINALKVASPPRYKQGFTLFFTGLSGSGKSTLAKLVSAKLIEIGQRPVTLLDGDVVRLNLSSELGFSKPHRDLNIRRIAFVANEISKNGGVAICAPIAPYTAMRRHARSLIAQHGAFIEIHVATPLSVCESRDRKGLYAKARQGLIPEFTGISDPYETPENPELSIDTSEMSPMEAAQEVFLYLLKIGFLDEKNE